LAGLACEKWRENTQPKGCGYSRVEKTGPALLGADHGKGAQIMAFETIILKKEGRVATITLNRPEKLNAINQLMTEEIRAALDEVNRDDGIRALILTGAGRGFCSGVDFGVMGAGLH
jgi:1,4-dihydroxy-2-naphthoyl-CoA synthase